MSADDKTIITFEDGDSSDLLSVLISEDALTEEQADQVRRRMRRAQISSHQAVLDLEFATQEVVYRALSRCNGLPFVIIGDEQISEAATGKVVAARTRAITSR